MDELSLFSRQLLDNVSSEPIISAAALLLGVLFVAWLGSVAFGKCWTVDPIWSLAPPALGVYWYHNYADENVNFWRSSISLLLLFLWGLRLTTNFILRGGIGHEDFRYTQFREKFGSRFWYLSFFVVFVSQGVFLFAACLSIFPAVTSSAPTTATDFIGATILGLGIVFETVADYQLDAFRADSGNRGKICDVGLWGQSRHPNYLGENMVWWGIFFLCLSCGDTAWTVVGPLLMSSLFVFVTIDMMEERQSRKMQEGWKQYCKEVPCRLLLGLNRKDRISLRHRPFDSFLLGWLLFACFFAVLMDIINILVPTGPISKDDLDGLAWPPTFMRELFWVWVNFADPLLRNNPLWYQVLCGYSPLFHAPFHVFCMYALVKEKQWIRPVALFWSGCLAGTMIPVFAAALLPGQDLSPCPTVFLAGYGSYLVVPLLVYFRFCKGPAFDQVEKAVPIE